MNTRINVAFCTDQSYLQHMCAALHSLLVHNTNTPLDVYVVSAPIADDISQWMKALPLRFDVRIFQVVVNESTLQELPTLQHFSRAMYYRLMLADLLEVERVIYLDSDLLVELNVLPLWSTNLEGYGCAGVSDPNQWNINRLHLAGDFYINSGVLVIDLKYWRENNIGLACMNWVQANYDKLHFPDQDAINCVLMGKKKDIPFHWNLNPFSLKKISDLTACPHRILHFSGSVKPWHLYSDFDMQQKYSHYLQGTPWETRFEPQQPVNCGQALSVANQYFDRADTKQAAYYYWSAMNFYLTENKINSVFLLEILNVAIGLLRGGQNEIACSLFRPCLKQWNLPIEHTFNIYKYPGFLNSP